MNKVLVVGCGDIGARLANTLVNGLAESEFELWGLRRDISSLAENIQGITADVTCPDTLKQLVSHHFNTVIFTLTPGVSSDERYQQVYVEGTANVLAALNRDSLQRVFFVSSTSVYHQNDEQWVDELSETSPERFSGQRLLEAERLCSEDSVPATIVRFAGIYGQQSVRLINDVLAAKASLQNYTNRIHRDDCAGFMAHLLQMPQESLQLCYIGVDSEPTKASEVKKWLAEQLECNVPAVSTDEAVSGNKRCSNRRMLETGYRLKYPNYREGYRPILVDLNYNQQQS